MSETIKEASDAHQLQLSTTPSPALEESDHSKEQVLDIPQIEAMSHIDSKGESAHSSSHLSQKESHPMSSLANSTSDEGATSHDSKVFNDKNMNYQGSSISPGTEDLAHSPLPAVSHSSHSSLVQSSHLMLDGSEQLNRGENSHLPSEMRPDSRMPVHAMFQATNTPRTPSQSPHGDQFLLQQYPVLWKGILALKDDEAAVQMHYVSGNVNIARKTFPSTRDGETARMRIVQRMKLDQLQLESVHKKMQLFDEHCVLMALPCGKDRLDVLQQSSNLKTCFINYLQQKQSAGIVNAALPGCQKAAYVIHIFPSCEFTDHNLNRFAPDLLRIICEVTHLVIVIATA